MHFILASGSPRRKEILEELGYQFEIKTGDFDESTVALDDPKEGVQKLALGKALAAVQQPGLYLGSDTVVVLDGVVMGKPSDEQDAFRMLRSLSGRTHEVCTGVALVTVGEDGTVEHTETFVEATEVTFFELTDEEIDRYIRTGEPMDKAGAYGIQGLGRVLVEGIRGDYETVVGLPAARVYRALREHDVVPE
ncbi:MAG: Maf family protein [Acutalibacteraceae bacterium]|nr:septum formation protein Maf [Clostridia bacterium]MBQ1529782.1 septum formation protein Maf [Clostridia bacterium]MBQ5580262.1 septum formation protein Maf [Clostridia bacterium]MEE3373710.1 Maf family protein [Acutalibacteraceae bacterium]